MNAISLALIDVAVCSGTLKFTLAGWLKAAALAHAQGLRISNHLWPEISARLLCCTPTAHWLEYANWWTPILAAPLRVEQGMAVIDDVIGAGMDWNEEAAQRFAA